MSQIVTDRISLREVLELESCGPTRPTGGSVHRLVRNSTLNLGVQGLYALFYLGVVSTLARGLGRDGLGRYYTLFALILVVQLVLETGVSTVLTRRIARVPETWRTTVAEAAGLCALMGLASGIVFLVLGSLAAWVKGEPILLFCFASAAVVCSAMHVQRCCAGVFAAFERFGYERVARLLQGGTFVVLVLGLVGHEWVCLETVLALLALSHVLAALFLLTSLQRRWHCLSWRLRLPHFKGWLSEAVPLGLGDVVRGLTWQVDTVLLGLLQPPAVAGIYSVAYRPLGPIHWIPLAILTAVFPSFARTAGTDRTALEQTFATSIRLLWMASLPIAVFFCLGAEPVILLLVGPEYLEAVLPLRVLIWITCLSFLSYPMRYLFTALGRTRLYAGLLLAVLGLQASLDLLLIPRWGYWGACTGSLLAEVLFTTGGLFLCRRLGISGIDWGALLRAAQAGAAMAAVLWAGHTLPTPWLLLLGVAATGLYLVLCVLLGALGWDEVCRLGTALRGSSPAVKEAS